MRLTWAELAFVPRTCRNPIVLTAWEMLAASSSGVEWSRSIRGIGFSPTVVDIAQVMDVGEQYKRTRISVELVGD